MENQAVYETENVIPLHEINAKIIIVVKKKTQLIFNRLYCQKRKQKLLIIDIKCVYSTVNCGLNDETFLKLDNKPKIEKIFYVIRKK